ncbi:uncharacterized protein LOC123897085 [Trifolium pratense]|nr:uncharacterized protein LOC123897085 [Trifolium pratense]
MNFLMRSTTHVDRDNNNNNKPSSVSESRLDSLPPPSAPLTGSHSLESFLSDDPYAKFGTRVEHFEGDIDTENDLKNDLAKHFDVSQEQGWIAIPFKELPEDWNHVSDIQSLHPLDRSFLFPGEQVHIVACLSACKQDTEIITPFKVAAVMSKNTIGHSINKENGNINNSVAGEEQLSPSGQDQNKENLPKEKNDHPTDVASGESLLRMEDHRRQTASLLEKFKSSHFFVRICESDEPLWSKHGSSEKSNSSKTNGQKISTIEVKETAKHESSISAVIDRANFDATISGGVARNSVKCFALPNGDIVVLLQVNVGVNFLRDPCIEILQYEKYEGKILSSENQDNSLYTNQDPCGDLLKWILPLDNILPTASRPLSPLLSTNSGSGNTSQRSNSTSSSGPQIFSFGSHFRSYSMSSMPQNTSVPPAVPLKAASSKPNFDIDDWDQISSQKFLRKKNGAEELLSFRGVSLERERFSVCCGLQGIHTPGRRWRRKLEIIQPVEIHSFAADCNSEDLLCVQIKNVAPAHAPDIVIYIDAITIIFEEATKSGPLSSLPFACIEAGNDHSLPNLALRKGEEHSFILKPATSVSNNLKVLEESPRLSNLQSGSSASKLSVSSNNSLDRSKISSIDDQYAVMVSCRCNYTTSKLFFKQPTSWRPRTSRDIMISVASEMSGESPGPYERNSQLAVQVLTLQASNLTSEDLTLTVLAPASFISPPSVVSLSSPTTPMSPFIGFTEFLGRINDDGKPQTVSTNDDVIPSSGLSCTHLWLQSRVPLGCIPSQSTATIKLELLPLTDGTITLDSLQIDVKEKGLTYIPERSLKINATSSISKGII